jgi:hypothetical protein
MWFADPLGKALGRIDMSGHTSYYIPSNTSGARTFGVVSGVDGNPIFTGTDGTNGYIGKVVLWVPRNVTAQAVSATHGSSVTATLATFSDNELVHGWSFTPSVSWGDGITSKGQVIQTSSSSPRQFKVVGSHTYSAAGSYPIRVSISEPGDQYAFSANTTASVK